MPQLEAVAMVPPLQQASMLPLRLVMVPLRPMLRLRVALAYRPRLASMLRLRVVLACRPRLASMLRLRVVLAYPPQPASKPRLLVVTVMALR
jgi:hypothetical protein